jgi:hypothetical protein
LGAAGGLAEGEAVVVHGEEGFLGGHFVYLEFYSVVIIIEEKDDEVED